VAFYVGLGPLTTVYLALTKGWAALCSFVGAAYVRESVSCCRPLLCVFTSAPTPSPPQKSLPEVPGLSFFGYSALRILRGAAPDRAVFLIWAELRYKARGKPKNGEIIRT
jgi:hypothetical protein